MSAVIRFPDLINLSLGSYERNRINARVLQLAFQTLAHHLNLTDLKVEFRGEDSVDIQKIIQDSDEEIRKEIVVSIIPEPVAGGNKEGRVFESSYTSVQSERRQKLYDIIEDKVIVESGKVLTSEVGRSASLARLEAKMKCMQGQIDSLEAQTIPSNDILLQVARTDMGSTPITDTLNKLFMKKRIAGTEEGMIQLSGLIEMITGEYYDIRHSIDKLQKELGQDLKETTRSIKFVNEFVNTFTAEETNTPMNLIKRILIKHKNASLKSEQSEYSGETDNEADGEGEGEPETKMSTDIKLSDEPAHSTDDFQFDPTNIDHQQRLIKELFDKDKALMELKANQKEVLQRAVTPFKKNKISYKKLNRLVTQHEIMKNNLEHVIMQIETLSDFADVIWPEVLESIPNMDEMAERLREIKLNPTEFKTMQEEKTNLSDIGKDLTKRVVSIEGSISKYAGILKKQEDSIHESTESLEEKQSYLRNALLDLEMKFQEDMKGLRKEEIEELEKLEKRIDDLSENQSDLCKQYKNFSNAWQSFQTTLKKLKEDIFYLKSTKLNKFEFDELLSYKADSVLLKTKVSHEEFSHTCNNITKTVDDTVRKIEEQNSTWQRFLTQHDASLQQNVTIEDFEVFKDMVLKYLKKLEESAKATPGEKEKLTAAAAKHKYIKNLKCISCNRNAVMKAEHENPCLPNLQKMPPSKGNRPVQIYERQIPDKEEISVNRYTGGSHTKLGPLQKVTHPGNLEAEQN